MHKIVTNNVETFHADVESFYDQETVKTGYITARVRNGENKQFPLKTIECSSSGAPQSWY